MKPLRNISGRIFEADDFLPHRFLSDVGSSPDKNTEISQLQQKIEGLKKDKAEDIKAAFDNLTKEIQRTNLSINEYQKKGYLDKASADIFKSRIIITIADALPEKEAKIWKESITKTQESIKDILDTVESEARGRGEVKDASDNNQTLDNAGEIQSRTQEVSLNAKRIQFINALREPKSKCYDALHTAMSALNAEIQKPGADIAKITKNRELVQVAFARVDFEFAKFTEGDITSLQATIGEIFGNLGKQGIQINTPGELPTMNTNGSAKNVKIRATTFEISSLFNQKEKPMSTTARMALLNALQQNGAKSGDPEIQKLLEKTTVPEKIKYTDQGGRERSIDTKPENKLYVLGAEKLMKERDELIGRQGKATEDQKPWIQARLELINLKLEQAGLNAEGRLNLATNKQKYIDQKEKELSEKFGELENSYLKNIDKVESKEMTENLKSFSEDPNSMSKKFEAILAKPETIDAHTVQVSFETVQRAQMQIYQNAEAVQKNFDDASKLINETLKANQESTVLGWVESFWNNPSDKANKKLDEIKSKIESEFKVSIQKIADQRKGLLNGATSAVARVKDMSRAVEKSKTEKKEKLSRGKDTALINKTAINKRIEELGKSKVDQKDAFDKIEKAILDQEVNISSGKKTVGTIIAEKIRNLTDAENKAGNEAAEKNDTLKRLDARITLLTAKKAKLSAGDVEITTLQAEIGKLNGYKAKAVEKVKYLTTTVPGELKNQKVEITVSGKKQEMEYGAALTELNKQREGALNNYITNSEALDELQSVSLLDEKSLDAHAANIDLAIAQTGVEFEQQVSDTKDVEDFEKSSVANTAELVNGLTKQVEEFKNMDRVEGPTLIRSVWNTGKAAIDIPPFGRYYMPEGICLKTADTIGWAWDNTLGKLGSVAVDFFNKNMPDKGYQDWQASGNIFASAFGSLGKFGKGLLVGVSTLIKEPINSVVTLGETLTSPAKLGLMLDSMTGGFFKEREWFGLKKKPGEVTDWELSTTAGLTTTGLNAILMLIPGGKVGGGVAGRFAAAGRNIGNFAKSTWSVMRSPFKSMARGFENLSNSFLGNKFSVKNVLNKEKSSIIEYKIADTTVNLNNMSRAQLSEFAKHFKKFNSGGSYSFVRENGVLRGMQDLVAKPTGNFLERGVFGNTRASIEGIRNATTIGEGFGMRVRTLAIGVGDTLLSAPRLIGKSALAVYRFLFNRWTSSNGLIYGAKAGFDIARISPIYNGLKESGVNVDDEGLVHMDSNYEFADKIKNAERLDNILLNMTDKYGVFGKNVAINARALMAFRMKIQSEMNPNSLAKIDTGIPAEKAISIVREEVEKQLGIPWVKVESIYNMAQSFENGNADLGDAGYTSTEEIQTVQENLGFMERIIGFFKNLSEGKLQDAFKTLSAGTKESVQKTIRTMQDIQKYSNDRILEAAGNKFVNIGELNGKKMLTLVTGDLKEVSNDKGITERPGAKVHFLNLEKFTSLNISVTSASEKKIKIGDQEYTLGTNEYGKITGTTGTETKLLEDILYAEKIRTEGMIVTGDHIIMVEGVTVYKVPMKPPMPKIEGIRKTMEGKVFASLDGKDAEFLIQDANGEKSIMYKIGTETMDVRTREPAAQPQTRPNNGSGTTR